MDFGTAAEHLAKRLNLANATAGTPNGVECRRHIIGAIKELSTTTFSFNILVADEAIDAGENDFTVDGPAGASLPSGTLAPVDLFWVYNNGAAGNDGHMLRKVSEIEMIHMELLAHTSDRAEAWSWKNNACHVYPVPTADWTLRGIYLRDGRIADGTQTGGVWSFVSDATTSIWLTDPDALEVVTAQAMANYLTTRGRPELAAPLRQQVASKIIPAVMISHHKRGKTEIDSWL